MMQYGFVQVRVLGAPEFHAQRGRNADLRRETNFIRIALVLSAFAAHPASAQAPVALAPTNQFSRLGYHEYGRQVAAADSVILAAARPAFAPLYYEGGNWVDAYRLDGSQWVNEAALFPLGGDSSNDNIYDDDDFGAALAVSPSGLTALVGAPLHDGEAKDGGEVFVFRALNSSWYQLGRLYLGYEAYGHFGAAIAIGGSPLRLAVGAPGDSSHDVAGAVRILTPGNCVSGFCHESEIGSPDDKAVQFGGSVAVGDDVLFVGAPGEYTDDGTNITGAVYVYEFDEQRPVDQQWVLAQKLQPDPVQISLEYFGAAIALSKGPDPVLVVGAFGERGHNRRADGAVYLFRRDGGQWVRAQKLAAPALSGQRPVNVFGVSLAISDDVLVVGSDWTPQEADGYGSAHIYRFDDSQWVRALVVSVPPGSYPLDGIGRSVAALHGQAVVGAPGTQPDYLIAGAALVVDVPLIADADRDGDADLIDTAAFVACFSGPVPAAALAPNCAPFDFDVDGDVDLFDAAVMQRAMSPLTRR